MATASDPAPVKQWEMLLECSICNETLTQPRTLSCFHSYCKHCLETFVATHRKKAVKAKAKVPEVFECPLCRTEFCVKEDENVEKIPSNHFINNMLELLTLQQQAQRIKCQSCKAKGPATSRCVTCENYLCGKCLEVHSNWPAFENHVVLTLEELAKPENLAKARAKPRCEKHDKVLKFYCETCKVLVCRYCADVNHIRPEHTWFPLADVVGQHKEALKTSSAIFEQQRNEAVQSNLKIEHAMVTLKNNKSKAKDAIIQQQQEILNAFTKKLEEEMAVLLDQVDMKYNEVNEPLVKQQADVKAYLAKTNSSLDFAKNIISNGSDEEILSLKHEVEGKAGSIEKERPELMEPVHNGGIEYQAKASNDVLENIKLNDLGKIVSPALKQTKTKEVQSLCERSTILNGDIEYAKQLAYWVEDKKFGWQLCYRASDDGWGAGDFHTKCDDVGPTVTLIKCGTNVFGGYTDQSWKVTGGIDGCKQSNVSFLFSLRNKHKMLPFKCPIYDHQNDKAIYCSNSCGPNFGARDGLQDLFICGNANANHSSQSNLGRIYQHPPGYQYGTPQTKALLAGSHQFTLTEIEVFRR